MPTGRLFTAWQAVAATAQLDYALVLPQLSPAAQVALWRQAGAQAAAQIELRDDPTLVRHLVPPSASEVTAAMAPDPAAITELRAWLARRLNWRAA